MGNNGWIKIHRKFIDWEWYDDINTKLVFLHCLLRANWEDDQWHGIPIQRGSFISSHGKIAEESGLSVSKVRTAINKLKSTGEIAFISTSKYTMVTICEYETYQAKDKKNDSNIDSNDDNQIADESQSIDNQIATSKKLITPKKPKKVSGEYTDEFKAFWGIYPRKINKMTCFDSWEKLGEADQESAMKGLPTFQFTEDADFIPHGATWLNKRRWEDEPDKPVDPEEDPDYYYSTYNKTARYIEILKVQARKAKREPFDMHAEDVIFRRENPET